MQIAALLWLALLTPAAFAREFHVSVNGDDGNDGAPSRPLKTISAAGHGPFLVDNNLYLSGLSLRDVSEGGVYVHNLMTGRILNHPEPRRSTPYHKAHSTALAGLSSVAGGDDRFYNNILVGNGGPPAAGPFEDPGQGEVRLKVW